MKTNIIKNIILGISGLGCLCGLCFTVVYIGHIPASIDKIIKYDVDKDFEQTETIYFRDKKSGPIIEKQYSSDKLGYVSISTYAYKGWDVMNLDNDISNDYKLNYSEKMDVGNKTVYIQYLESDDMPDMVMSAFIEYKSYIFNFRLTNFDDQITDLQKQKFKDFIKSINFIGE